MASDFSKVDQKGTSTPPDDEETLNLQVDWSTEEEAKAKRK